MSIGERWIILGDSIQANVYVPGSGYGDNKHLTAALLPQSINISINNLSAPGARLADGGLPGFGAASNLNAITMVRGSSPMTGIICTLGTNDWANPSTSAQSFLDAYRALITRCKSLGMIFVGMSPLNRHDGYMGVQKADGVFTLAQWQALAIAVCQEQSVRWIQGDLAPLTAVDLADGIHPNAGGHDKLAPWLITKMRAWGYWLNI